MFFILFYNKTIMLGKIYCLLSILYISAPQYRRTSLDRSLINFNTGEYGFPLGCLIQNSSADIYNFVGVEQYENEPEKRFNKKNIVENTLKRAYLMFNNNHLDRLTWDLFEMLIKDRMILNNVEPGRMEGQFYDGVQITHEGDIIVDNGVSRVLAKWSEFDIPMRSFVIWASYPLSWDKLRPIELFYSVNSGMKCEYDEIKYILDNMNEKKTNIRRLINEYAIIKADRAKQAASAS